MLVWINQLGGDDAALEQLTAMEIEYRATAAG